MGSCSKDAPIYTNSQMWKLAFQFDPKIELVPIPEGQGDRRILCKNYGKGCKTGSGKRILIRKVEMIVVEFDTVENARIEAQKIGQYHARNWLLDDVTNEPVLESFVKTVYDAKKP